MKKALPDSTQRPQLKQVKAQTTEHPSSIRRVICLLSFRCQRSSRTFFRQLDQLIQGFLIKLKFRLSLIPDSFFLRFSDEPNNGEDDC